MTLYSVSEHLPDDVAKVYDHTRTSTCDTLGNALLLAKDWFDYSGYSAYVVVTDTESGEVVATLGNIDTGYTLY